jgi:hypothetical protein
MPGPPQPIFPPPPMIGTPAGLPSYTLPPTAGQHDPGSAGSEGTKYPSGRHPLFDKPSSGFGGTDRSRQPFGGGASQASGASESSGGGLGRSGRLGRGASTTPVSTPPGRPTTYGSEHARPPQQRGEGTVYGGFGPDSPPDVTMPVNSADMTMPVSSPIDMTMPVSMNPVENSGSLTGHILAQGWDQGRDTNRRSNVKVALAMLVVLLALVGISLLFLATAGSAFSDWINGIFKG